MGDRANVFIADDGDRGIYFYTHREGARLPLIVRDALRRGRARWDDPQYLNRIIFSEMIKDSVRDLTGYGISSRIGDNSHPIVVIRGQVVGFARVGQEPRMFVSWSFEAFCELPDEEILTAYDVASVAS